MSGMWWFTGGPDLHVTGLADEGPGDCRERREGMGCTRPVGHAGRHVAGGPDYEALAAWPGDHEPTAADLTGEA